LPAFTVPWTWPPAGAAGGAGFAAGPGAGAGAGACAFAGRMRRPPNKHTSRDKRFIRLDFLGLRTQIRPHFSRVGSLVIVLPSRSSRASKGFGFTAVVSHISHETSEMWGTLYFASETEFKGLFPFPERFASETEFKGLFPFPDQFASKTEFKSFGPYPTGSLRRQSSRAFFRFPTGSLRRESSRACSVSHRLASKFRGRGAARRHWDGRVQFREA
jgi:hypothetical protein